ncbi:MAG: hypothetical protein HY868_08625 [Chloroflexi bacterium]|nr:hypothetical protein [Chloroflexota bacterium]
MDNSSNHPMRLETRHATGAEEWLCDTCGRRFVLQLPPAYKKIVLVRGDENVSHTGGTGGLRIESARPTPKHDDDISNDDLSLWRDGLADIDLT